MSTEQRTLPRGWPAFLSLLTAAIFGWAATVLPWQDWTTFSIVTTVVAVAHLGHGILAAVGHRLRGSAWRVQSLVSLVYLGYVTWNIFSVSTYIAALYGGLGKGVAAGLAAAWAVVAFLVLPLSAWGLAATGGLRWGRREQGGAAVAGVLVVLGLWRAASLPEAEAALDVSPEGDALRDAVAAALPSPDELAEAPADAPGLLVQQAVECEQPPGPGRATVVATSRVEVAGGLVEARSRCVQRASLDEALTELGAQLRAEALRGPLKVDVITGTQDLAPVAPVVDAMLLRPALDGVCEGTRCLMPWQLVALDQFNEFMPIKVVPDLRFGFDPAIVRKALVWPGRPEIYDPRVEGLRRLTVASFVQDEGGELHRLRRMRNPGPELSSESLRNAVDAAERYILASQQPDGRFAYKVDPFTGRVSQQGFALARQAGTTLVICELARDDEEVREVVRRALAMLVSTMHEVGDDMGVLVHSKRDDVTEAGLGATALSTIALLSCRDRVGDEFDDAIGRMTRFLLHMQRDNGSFHPRIDLRTAEPIPGPDPLYAVGQAVFSLTLLERLVTEQDLPHLPDAERTRAAVEAAMTYTAEEYWNNFATGFFWMEENWHCLAARASLGHHRHDAYERFCIDYSHYKVRLILDESDGIDPQWVGGYGFGNVLTPHNTGSSGFGEAMAASLAIQRARGEDTTADEAVIRRAIAFLVHHQWDEVDCFACATEPLSMVGAFSEHMASPEIRIDFVQHAMAGMGHGGRMLGLLEGSSVPAPLGEGG